MSRKLGERQKQILQCISDYTDEHGYPPTVREIGELVGLSSSSTVHAHLRILEREGYISRDAVLTRAIRVLNKSKKSQKKAVKNLPIVGSVAAGNLTLAVEDIEDLYPVPEHLLSGSEGFMLRIKGDSMIEDGIKEGDIVVVRMQNTAENGDTVVAMVDDEATVKRFYKENGRIKLQPANSSMKPMYFDNINIIGKVVGLIREMS
ncbi:MAG: transcriptional repressor LexA [Armatimonadota bacterium]